MEYKPNTKQIKILTPKGYQAFDGICKHFKKKCYQVTTTNFSLSCSEDHLFCVDYDAEQFVSLDKLEPGHCIYTQNGYEPIFEIKRIQEQELYDFVNVQNTESYYTNGILSHNCCVFLNTGDSSIDDALFAEMEPKCKSPKIVLDNGHYKIWEEPNEERTYVAGVDTGEGVGQDYSTIQILDITDLKDIRQVAVYRNNEIVPAEYSTKVYEILRNWGSPLALIERNNCGAQIVDRLIYDFGYQKIVNYGGVKSHRKKQMPGLISHTNVKHKAILNERYWINELRCVAINDILTLKEFKDFIRYPNGLWKAASGKNDDLVMAFIFALFILDKDLTEMYFEIIDLDDNGKPKIIEPMDLLGPVFEKATSIYDNNEIIGVNNNMILPVYFGEPFEQKTEMEELLMQGFIPYGKF